jgi:hypothetical protein
MHIQNYTESHKITHKIILESVKRAPAGSERAPAGSGAGAETGAGVGCVRAAPAALGMVTEAATGLGSGGSSSASGVGASGGGAGGRRRGRGRRGEAPSGSGMLGVGHGLEEEWNETVWASTDGLKSVMSDDLLGDRRTYDIMSDGCPRPSDITEPSELYRFTVVDELNAKAHFNAMVH